MLGIRIANGSQINGIGVYRVNNNAVNISCFLQPHSFPCLSGVHTFINAFTNIKRVTGIAFASSGPYYIGVSLLDGYRPDILCGLIIEYWCPGITTINCLPHTTRCSAEINNIWIINYNINRSNATTHTGRANIAGL